MLRRVLRFPINDRVRHSVPFNDHLPLFLHSPAESYGDPPRLTTPPERHRRGVPPTFSSVTMEIPPKRITSFLPDELLRPAVEVRREEPEQPPVTGRLDVSEWCDSAIYRATFFGPRPPNLGQFHTFRMRLPTVAPPEAPKNDVRNYQRTDRYEQVLRNCRNPGTFNLERT